jgi:eukaryotic-like serine/threonine-protein kinase
LLVRIIVAPVPLPSHFVQDLPTTFDRWWEKASQRDPAARFQSAREFGDSLAIAFGHSKGLSGDGGMPRAMAMSDPGTGNYPAGSPFGATPNPSFGNTPNPAYGNPSFGNTPNPAYGNPPQPGYGGTQALPGMGPTTGASMSRTFDGPAPAPPKGKGVLVAIGGAAIVVLALGVLGLSFVMKGKEAPASATAPPAATSAIPAQAAAVVPPTAPTQPAAPVAPVVDAPVAAAPVAAPAAAAPAAVVPSVKPAHAAPAAKPAASPAASPAKKTKVDLGI